MDSFSPRTAAETCSSISPLSSVPALVLSMRVKRSNIRLSVIAGRSLRTTLRSVDRDWSLATSRPPTRADSSTIGKHLQVFVRDNNVAQSCQETGAARRLDPHAQTPGRCTASGAAAQVALSLLRNTFRALCVMQQTTLRVMQQTALRSRCAPSPQRGMGRPSSLLGQTQIRRTLQFQLRIAIQKRTHDRQVAEDAEPI